MTMFPAPLSSSSLRYANGGGFSEGVGYDCFISLGGGGFISDLMAEDESRTETSTNNNNNEEEEEAAAAGSSSKDININIHDEQMNPEDNIDDHSRWLQLTLGGGHMQSTNSDGHHIPSAPPSLDLDLLPAAGGSSSRQPAPAAPPQLIFQVPEFRGHLPTSSTTFFLQPHPAAGAAAVAMNSVPSLTLQQLQETANYNYLQLIRPAFPANLMMTTTTSPGTLHLNPPVSSSSSFSGSTEQHGRPLHVHRRLNVARVVNPPRRPHSGVWFMLQASQNQAKEPFLPQIPKSYLRIKDGRMTVGLLIKYLVNKLELGSESEVEITCKGHRLLSLSTLQYVRDTIWNNPTNDIGFTLVPQSSATISHFMVLNYGRIA